MVYILKRHTYEKLPDDAMLTKRGKKHSMGAGFHHEMAGLELNGLGGSNALNRKQVQNVPFRYICNIEYVHHRGSNLLGTGTLIGPRAVLTVAHALVDTTRCRKLDPKRIRVIPGQVKTGERPFGSSRAVDIKIDPGICGRDLVGGDNNLDFAIIILKRAFDKPFGSFGRVGFWGEKRPVDDSRGTKIGALQGWRPGKFKVNHSGYGALNSGVQSHWYSDTLLGSSGNKLFINSKIQQGESGSPVWVTRDRSLGGRHLFGIVVTGYGPETSGIRIAKEAEALLIHPGSKIEKFIEKYRLAES